ncbi:unnamed protein product [Mesocestoides corti]|uniref:Uncharacterized protein n=1 Tax=Mesocestoides corti TaxID=53468 RepID=A0A0R3U4X4_MESCO|nr:unnamed protein product [Mesocestoides corti]
MRTILKAMSAVWEADFGYRSTVPNEVHQMRCLHKQPSATLDFHEGLLSIRAGFGQVFEAGRLPLHPCVLIPLIRSPHHERKSILRKPSILRTKPNLLMLTVSFDSYHLPLTIYRFATNRVILLFDMATSFDFH